MFTRMLLAALAPLMLNTESTDADRYLLIGVRRGEGSPRIGEFSRVDLGPGVRGLYLLVEAPRDPGWQEDADSSVYRQTIGRGGCVVPPIPSPLSMLVLRDLSGEQSDRTFAAPNLCGWSWHAGTRKIALSRMRSVHIAVYNQVLSYPELYVLDVESGKQAAIGLGGWPRYSSDGEWIAFALRRSFDAGIRSSMQLGVMRPDGSDRKLIVDGSRLDRRHVGDGSAVLWSPTMPKLIYWCAVDESSTNGELRCHDVVTGLDVGVTEGARRIFDRAQFTCDGSRFLFVRDGQIWSWSVSDERLHQVTAGSGDQLLAASPDGTRVAFYRPKGAGDHPLWIHDFRTGDERPLLIEAHSDLIPGRFVWSPDGRWIAMNRFSVTDSKAEILLIDSRRGLLQTLVRPGGCGPWFCWQKES